MWVGPIVGRQEKALRIYVITRCRVTANKYSTSLVPSWPCFFEPIDHHQKLNTITNDVNIEKCQDVIWDIWDNLMVKQHPVRLPNVFLARRRYF